MQIACGENHSVALSIDGQVTHSFLVIFHNFCLPIPMMLTLQMLNTLLVLLRYENVLEMTIIS